MSASILVVDDEPKVREFVHRVLQNAGYHVVSASTGDQALAILQERKASLDLLVTDLRMPGLHGKDLAQVSRRLKPRLKVLFLTGYAGDLFVDRQVLDDDTAFLEKPVSSRALCEATRLLLSGSLAPDDAPELEDAIPLLTEYECVRVALASGATARLLATGASLGPSDIDEIIAALQRYGQEIETGSESQQDGQFLPETSGDRRE